MRSICCSRTIGAFGGTESTLLLRLALPVAAATTAFHQAKRTSYHPTLSSKRLRQTNATGRQQVLDIVLAWHRLGGQRAQGGCNVASARAA